MAEESKQPSEEELLQQLEAELRKLKVVDLLAQTVYTVSSLAWRRLAPGDERDLTEARLAIDALKALVPVLEPSLPDEAKRDFNQVVANLQLAYAKAAAEARPKAEPEPPVHDSGPGEGARGNREVPPTADETAEPEAKPEADAAS